MYTLCTILFACFRDITLRLLFIITILLPFKDNSTISKDIEIFIVNQNFCNTDSTLAAVAIVKNTLS